MVNTTAIRRVLLTGVLLLHGCAMPGLSAAGSNVVSDRVGHIHIDYFYEAGCEECDRMTHEIFPELETLYGGFYELHPFDVAIETNYLQLVAYQEKLGIEENERVYLVLNGSHLLSGFDEIKGALLPLVDQLLNDMSKGSAECSLSSPAPTLETMRDRLQQRVRRFTLAGVTVAGLLDGINPCAISTLVFFMSLLMVSHVRGRTLFLSGLMFCMATFITYLALGFGLFHVLYRLSGWMPIRRTIDFLLASALIALAIFSFRDAARYRVSRDPKDIAVRLPYSITLKIQQIMNRGLKSHHFILGGFGIGILVTVLESVCTGQVYVPTLVWVIRNGSSPMLALGYLLIYNFMFVLPLICILLLAGWGLNTERLLAWSRRNVVISKTLLGLFFLFLSAVFLLL